MAAQSAAATVRPIAEAKPSRGGVGGRSRVARRRRQLVALYLEALGGAVSGQQMVDVERAAELVVIAETERARAMRGEVVDLSQLSRLESTADRAVRRLGIKPGAVPSKPQSLKEYAATKAARRAADSAGEAPA